MRIELGTHVLTSDDQDAGTIDRLILDPTTAAIKAVVIHKGLLLSRDVEVSPDQLTVDYKGAVRLSLTADEAAGLPEFFEANYTATPPPGYIPLAGYPASGLFWPIAYDLEPAPPAAGDVLDKATRAEVDEAMRRQDLENALLTKGGEVRTRDGEKIGSIHHLTFDPESGRLASFVIRSGVILTDDTEVPASTIAYLDDGVIHLRVDATWLATFRALVPGRNVWSNDSSLLGTIERLDGDDLDNLMVASLDGKHQMRIPLGKVRLENGQVFGDVSSVEVSAVTSRSRGRSR